MYYILYTFVYLHALLPWKVLYFLSDIMFFFIYKVVRYRKEVVHQGLLHSFPEKSLEEILKIEKEFYHHFCDYIVETMKLAHISDDKMRKRMSFKNIDSVNENMSSNKSCMMLIGHYGSWEWIPSICLWLPPNIIAGQIYHPLNNKAFDKLMLKLRSRFGSISISMNRTLREIIKMKNDGTQSILGFIADQRPLWNSIEYWTNFLNQDTPIISGFERIAKQSEFVVMYLDISKIKRGYYEGEFKLLATDPKKCERFEIVEVYTREIEKTILRNPAYWLWTHKRWKYKKENWLKLRKS